jgi:nitrile hydratase accessory protein
LSDDAPGFGGLRRRDGEPIFAEPWQAEIMALAAKLLEGKRFTAAQWSATLGGEIRHAADHGGSDDPATYYACAVRALERLTISAALVGVEELARMKDAWIRAYEATPHGQPVTLSAAGKP